jgi:hypothetical protein
MHTLPYLANEEQLTLYEALELARCLGAHKRLMPGDSVNYWARR